MSQPEDVTIDLAGIQLTDAESGQPVSLASIRGVQVLVLLRHRHCLPCQQHLVQVHEAAASSADARIGLMAVGFSPPGPLAAIARHLGWPGLVLTDPGRVLYQRLGVGRASLRRVYSPGTLATYAGALARGHRLARPLEDTRQLGADAIMAQGAVRRLRRSRTPDDRPTASEVITAALACLG
jgi:hypothetical protein